MADIVDLTDGAEENRRRDGDLAAAAGTVILHAVFPGNTGAEKCFGIIIQCLVGTDKLRHLVFAVRSFLTLNRVRPTEVVQTGDVVRISTGGDCTADRQVDTGCHHVISVDIAVTGKDTGSENDPFGSEGFCHINSGIGCNVAFHPGIGFDHAETFDFVVILTCFVFAGAEIESAHKFDHIFFHVTIFEFGFIKVRGYPFCFELELGKTFVHVFDIETADCFIAPGHMEFTVISEFTENSCFHIAAGCESKEFIQFFRRNSKTHTFLGFGNQDFPRLHTGIFQRSFLQVHTAAIADRCHFPDRGGKTACPVIRNKTVKKTAAGFGKEVAHAFLCDRVADLNRLNRTVFVQFFTGECRTVDTVFTDTAAGHNDDVTRFDIFFPAVLITDLPGNRTDSTAINQRFTNITFIKIFPADRIRDTALITAVDHTFVNTGTETARMEQAFRHIFFIRKRRTETISPDVQQKVGTHTGPHRVTVHTDDTGHCTSIGVKSGRRVVCFCFISHIETIVETDHTGVVSEYGNEPVDLFADFFCTFLDERFVKRNDMFFFLCGNVFIIHRSSKDFVFTVF